MTTIFIKLPKEGRWRDRDLFGGLFFAIAYYWIFIYVAGNEITMGDRLQFAVAEKHGYSL